MVRVAGGDELDALWMSRVRLKMHAGHVSAADYRDIELFHRRINLLVSDYPFSTGHMPHHLYIFT
jgi:hypothetical protein